MTGNMTGNVKGNVKGNVIELQKAAAAAADNGDWLGYGAYADALWSRIETALKKDEIKGELGDDPLVIGVFGEWGGGQVAFAEVAPQKGGLGTQAAN